MEPSCTTATRLDEEAVKNVMPENVCCREGCIIEFEWSRTSNFNFFLAYFVWSNLLYHEIPFRIVVCVVSEESKNSFSWIFVCNWKTCDLSDYVLRHDDILHFISMFAYQIQRWSNVYAVLYESRAPKIRVDAFFGTSVFFLAFFTHNCSVLLPMLCILWTRPHPCLSHHPFHLYTPICIQHENDSLVTGHSVTGIGLFSSAAENVFSQNIHTWHCNDTENVRRALSSG